MTMECVVDAFVYVVRFVCESERLRSSFATGNHIYKFHL